MKRRLPFVPSRGAVILTALLVLTLLLQACGPAAPAAPAGQEAAPAGGPVVNSLGRELPADAAPAGTAGAGLSLQRLENVHDH